MDDTILCKILHLYWPLIHYDRYIKTFESYSPRYDVFRLLLKKTSSKCFAPPTSYRLVVRLIIQPSVKLDNTFASVPRQFKFRFKFRLLLPHDGAEERSFCCI